MCRCARAAHVDMAGLELAEHRSPCHAAQRQCAVSETIAAVNRGYGHVIPREIICMRALLPPRIHASLRDPHNPPERFGGFRQRHIECSLASSSGSDTSFRDVSVDMQFAGCTLREVIFRHPNLCCTHGARTDSGGFRARASKSFYVRFWFQCTTM